MRKQKRVVVFCTMLVACLAITGFAAFRSTNQEGKKHKRAEYPVVDYNAPESGDAGKRAKRRKKGEKYNDSPTRITPSPEIVKSFDYIPFPPDITALPVAKSASVIVGTVTDAQAHLSPDKTGVYSEFSVQVEEVIKNDSHTPLRVGEPVTVERPGGRVRIPTGQIQEHMTTLNPLGVGDRYVLFLVRIKDDYRVFTGYKLEGGRVSHLDTLPIPESYEGAEVATFLDKLRRNDITYSSNGELQ